MLKLNKISIRETRTIITDDLSYFTRPVCGSPEPGYGRRAAGWTGWTGGGTAELGSCSRDRLLERRCRAASPPR